MLGVACALWLLPVIVGPQLQQLRLDRDRWMARAQTLEAEVKKMQAAASRHRSGPVVTRARVELQVPDERVALEAQRRLQAQLTAEAVGRPVEAVSPLLLYSRLQGAVLTVDGVRYQLEVRLLSVGAELALFGVLQPL